MPTKPCSCGLPFDADGQCQHCDRQPTERDTNGVRSCPVSCVPCFTRDRLCEICRVDCATPTGARAHSVSCRQREAQAKA